MNCANHPEREKTAFCQNCGKPLCQECTRVIGTAVFCEPCLAQKISGAAPPPPAGNYVDPAAQAAYAAGAVPPPFNTGAPNPGLAALLGFIPGVGAMYNGQYAKGVVHLIVFAVLVSLADQHGIFGLFVAGWVFYQVFEAYGTARARRDGTPLPNPFGLNDLSERLGFGRAWSTGAPGGAPVVPPPPPDAYTPPATPYTPPVNPYAAPAGAPPAQAAWETPWTSTYVPPANPYMNPPAYNQPAYDPNIPLPTPRNRFPVGAFWLIGLGVLFLIGNAGIFHGSVDYLLPLFLIGLGVWIFVHRMTSTGGTLADDGTPLYRMRLFSSLRGSVWVILVGVMFLLANFHILSWGRSWPLFIIVAGLMTIFEKTMMNSASATAYPGSPYQAPYPPYQAPSAPASSPTSVVPPYEAPGQNNQEEGR